MQFTTAVDVERLAKVFERKESTFEFSGGSNEEVVRLLYSATKTLLRSQSEMRRELRNRTPLPDSTNAEQDPEAAKIDSNRETTEPLGAKHVKEEGATPTQLEKKNAGQEQGTEGTGLQSPSASPEAAVPPSASPIASRRAITQSMGEESGVDRGTPLPATINVQSLRTQLLNLQRQIDAHTSALKAVEVPFGASRDRDSTTSRVIELERITQDIDMRKPDLQYVNTAVQSYVDVAVQRISDDINSLYTVLDLSKARVQEVLHRGLGGMGDRVRLVHDSLPFRTVLAALATVSTNNPMASLPVDDAAASVMHRGASSQPHVSVDPQPQGREHMASSSPSPSAPPVFGVEVAESSRGVTTTKVFPGSPAHDAGIREGDVIVTLNGARISARSQLRGLLVDVARAGAGDRHGSSASTTRRVPVTVLRGDAQHDLIVQL